VREPQLAIVVVAAVLLYLLVMRVDLLSDRVDALRGELRTVRAELADAADTDLGCVPVALPPLRQLGWP
jgi:hypothetical protein